MSHDVLLRVLHWVMALIVIAMLISGYVMTGMNDFNDFKWVLYRQHESFGMLIFLLLLLRLFIRIRYPFSGSIKHTVRWQRYGYIASFLLLYGLMLLMPISGYLQRSPYGVHIFQIAVPVIRDQFYIAGIAFNYHILFAKAFVAAVATHILAYIYHKAFSKPTLQSA